MARKVFIASGHSNTPGKDNGSTGNGYVEGFLTVEFRDLLVAQLKAIGVVPTTDPASNVLAETIQYFKALTNPNALLVDIHFNAGPSTATGVEVEVPDDSNPYERKVAGEIANEISRTFGIQNRGVKPESETARKRLGWMRLIGNNILIELCFITNYKDMMAYQAYKTTLAKRLALIIKNNL